jgi:CMP-N-acetylneuraminic acid synthetase
VLKLEEFVIFKKGALNFKMTEITERTKIEPLYLITNGCFIARKKIMARYRNYFGIKPYLFEVGTLEAMEIKKASDLSIANDLISLFFKRGLEKGRQ